MQERFKIIIGTKRLLDSVWTTVLELDTHKKNDVRVLHYSRDVEKGYENERDLPKIVLLEEKDRTVTAVKIDGEVHEVINKENIFSYGA